MEYAIVKQRKNYALQVTIAGEYSGLVRGLPLDLIRQVCEAQTTSVLPASYLPKVNKRISKLVAECKQVLEQRRVVGFKPVLHTTAPTPAVSTISRRACGAATSRCGLQECWTPATARSLRRGYLPTSSAFTVLCGSSLREE